MAACCQGQSLCARTPPAATRAPKCPPANRDWPGHAGKGYFAGRQRRARPGRRFAWRGSGEKRSVERSVGKGSNNRGVAHLSLSRAILAARAPGIDAAGR